RRQKRQTASTLCQTGKVGALSAGAIRCSGRSPHLPGVAQAFGVVLVAPSCRRNPTAAVQLSDARCGASRYCRLMLLVTKALQELHHTDRGFTPMNHEQLFTV